MVTVLEKIIQIRLSKEQIKYLDEICKKYDYKSRADVIRDAICDMIESKCNVKVVRRVAK